MRSFVCNFWEVIVIVSTVAGIVSSILAVKSRKKIVLRIIFAVVCATVLIVTGLVHLSSSKITNVVGLELRDAVSLLRQSDLYAVITPEGCEMSDIVSEQDPLPGTYVKTGSKIKLTVSPTSTSTPSSTPVPMSTSVPTTEPTPAVDHTHEPDTIPKQGIEILTYDCSKHYQNDIKQSSFSIQFMTSKPFYEAKLEVGGQTYPVKNGSGTTYGNMVFDREYFYLSAYTFLLTVRDEEGNEAQKELSITLDEVTISLSDLFVNLKVGDRYQLTAYVTGIAGHSVGWNSSNNVVAIVNEEIVLGESYGVATVVAEAPGQTVIIATVGDKSARCAITVE